VAQPNPTTAKIANRIGGPYTETTVALMQHLYRSMWKVLRIEP
jgi:hypothetical protein